jgi:hypothetical protein
MTKIETFKKALFCSLSPARGPLPSDPVSAFSLLGVVDKYASTLFHEEECM